MCEDEDILILLGRERGPPALHEHPAQARAPEFKPCSSYGYDVMGWKGPCLHHTQYKGQTVPSVTSLFFFFSKIVK